ncbi:MAG: HAD family hydrolase [Methylococcaceae bacterium]|nr:HAD family hydrolase [Methylococcaceae bacterium]
MKKSVIYALDFDGVICDSTIETGISGWKAAAQIWTDFTTPLPPSGLIERFRQVRPVMGTGYEAILIVRLLHNGETVEAIMDQYEEKKQKLIKDSKLSVDMLKKLFGETRDHWIKKDLDDWVGMNPLFPGIAEKLQGLSEQGIWYIVTTKQERFVRQILDANQVQLPAERIFGLDRNMSKEDVLIELDNKHAEEKIYFIEDMLSSLTKVLNNRKLKSVKLFLAIWGYNTAAQKQDIEKLAIELIDIDSFLS